MWVAYIGEPKNMKYGHYQVLFDMCIAYFAEAKRMEEPYAQKLVKSQTGIRFLFTWKYYAPKSGHNNFNDSRERNCVF